MPKAYTKIYCFNVPAWKYQLVIKLTFKSEPEITPNNVEEVLLAKLRLGCLTSIDPEKKGKKKQETIRSLNKICTCLTILKGSLPDRFRLENIFLLLRGPLLLRKELSIRQVLNPT